MKQANKTTLTWLPITRNLALAAIISLSLLTTQSSYAGPRYSIVSDSAAIDYANHYYDSRAYALSAAYMAAHAQAYRSQLQNVDLMEREINRILQNCRRPVTDYFNLLPDSRLLEAASFYYEQDKFAMTAVYLSAFFQVFTVNQNDSRARDSMLDVLEYSLDQAEKIPARKPSNRPKKKSNMASSRGDVPPIDLKPTLFLPEWPLERRP